jgi:hypothetical protein
MIKQLLDAVIIGNILKRLSSRSGSVLSKDESVAFDWKLGNRCQANAIAVIIEHMGRSGDILSTMGTFKLILIIHEASAAAKLHEL